MTFYARDAETWRTGSALFVRDANVWRTGSAAWVRDVEEWRQFFGGVEPSLVTAVASVSQQGTQSGGNCIDPYIFSVEWTIANSSAGYTISIDAGFDLSTPPSVSSVATGLALASSPYADTWEGFYFDAGETQRYYRALVKIIRTSDSGIVSAKFTNILSTEIVGECTV
jgi:hypothetical protein